MTTTNSWNLTQHEKACSNSHSGSEQENVTNKESQSGKDLSIHHKSSKRVPMKTSTQVAEATDAIDWSKVSQSSIFLKFHSMKKSKNCNVLMLFSNAQLF